MEHWPWSSTCELVHRRPIRDRHAVILVLMRLESGAFDRVFQALLKIDLEACVRIHVFRTCRPTLGVGLFCCKMRPVAHDGALINALSPSHRTVFAGLIFALVELDELLRASRRKPRLRTHAWSSQYTWSINAMMPGHQLSSQISGIAGCRRQHLFGCGESVTQLQWHFAVDFGGGIDQGGSICWSPGKYRARALPQEQRTQAEGLLPSPLLKNRDVIEWLIGTPSTNKHLNVTWRTNDHQGEQLTTRESKQKIAKAKTEQRSVRYAVFST